MVPTQYFLQSLQLVAVGVMDRLVLMQLVALAVVTGAEQVRLELQIKALLAVVVMVLMLLAVAVVQEQLVVLALVLVALVVLVCQVR
jgi:hypothetical protein